MGTVAVQARPIAVFPGVRGLCVKGVFRTVSHAALRLVLCALRCFALHALRSALCVCFACPRCSAGGDGLNDACNDVKHGATPWWWMIEIDFIIGGL